MATARGLSEPVVTENTPTMPEGPPDGVLRSLVGMESYFTLSGDDEITTTRLDFSVAGFIEPYHVAALMEQARGAIQASGEDLLAYALWEVPGVEVEIPNQICIPNTDICWTPPGAGSSVALVRQYRLWIMTGRVGWQPIPRYDLLPQYGGQYGARGLFGWIVALVAMIVALGVITGWFGIATGQVKAGEVMSWLKDVLRVPGENVSGAFSWPMFAFGFAIVAGAILLPAFTTIVSGRIGPATVEVSTRAPRR